MLDRYHKESERGAGRTGAANWGTESAPGFAAAIQTAVLAQRFEAYGLGDGRPPFFRGAETAARRAHCCVHSVYGMRAARLPEKSSFIRARISIVVRGGGTPRG